MRDIAFAIACAAATSPIASHLLFTQPGILDDDKPDERKLGIAAGLAWLPVAEAMVVYTDYGESAGMTAAIKLAEGAGIPVERYSLWAKAA
jgi:hypothetical protein